MEPFSTEPGVRPVRSGDGPLPDEGAPAPTGGGYRGHSRIESGGDDSRGFYECHPAHGAGGADRGKERGARRRRPSALVAGRAGVDAGGPRGGSGDWAENYLVRRV